MTDIEIPNIERFQIGGLAPAPVAEVLSASFDIINGVLSSNTIRAMLTDLDPYTGKEVEAMRSSLYMVLAMRGYK